MYTIPDIIKRFNYKDVMAIAKTSVAVCACLIASVNFSSCKSHKSISGYDAKPHQEVTINVGNATPTQKKIAEEAYSWIGTPYTYAKAEKGKGTDCSGMVMVIYENITGEKIPRNSAKQAEFCNRIADEDVATGDLVFFATGNDADKISHVGIVVDSENFIHASSSKGVVLSKISNPYYVRTFKMFGRVPSRKEYISLSENK